MEKIPVSGLISPIFDTDQYPVIDPRLGIDGIRSLDDLQQMYNLPLEKRRGGMMVAIPNTSSNNSTYYSLKPQGNGVTWSVGSPSNWYTFFPSGGSASSTSIRYTITNEQVNVPLNYQYLVWGGMTIATGGTFVNDGQTYVLNGTISMVDGGTFSGSGQFNYIKVPTVYSESFTSDQDGTVITHGLNTQDIVYSVRDTSSSPVNFLTVNVEIIDNNSIKVSSIFTFSTARITIFG